MKKLLLIIILIISLLLIGCESDLTPEEEAEVENELEKLSLEDLDTISEEEDGAIAGHAFAGLKNRRLLKNVNLESKAVKKIALKVKGKRLEQLNLGAPIYFNHFELRVAANELRDAINEELTTEFGSSLTKDMPAACSRKYNVGKMFHNYIVFSLEEGNENAMNEIIVELTTLSACISEYDAGELDHAIGTAFREVLIRDALRGNFETLGLPPMMVIYDVTKHFGEGSVIYQMIDEDRDRIKTYVKESGLPLDQILMFDRVSGEVVGIPVCAAGYEGDPDNCFRADVFVDSLTPLGLGLGDCPFSGMIDQGVQEFDGPEGFGTEERYHCTPQICGNVAGSNENARELEQLWGDELGGDDTEMMAGLDTCRGDPAARGGASGGGAIGAISSKLGAGGCFTAQVFGNAANLGSDDTLNCMVGQSQVGDKLNAEIGAQAELASAMEGMPKPGQCEDVGKKPKSRAFNNKALRWQRTEESGMVKWEAVGGADLPGGGSMHHEEEHIYNLETGSYVEGFTRTTITENGKEERVKVDYGQGNSGQGKAKRCTPKCDDSPPPPPKNPDPPKPAAEGHCAEGDCSSGCPAQVAQMQEHEACREGPSKNQNIAGNLDDPQDQNRLGQGVAPVAQPDDEGIKPAGGTNFAACSVSARQNSCNAVRCPGGEAASGSFEDGCCGANAADIAAAGRHQSCSQTQCPDGEAQYDPETRQCSCGRSPANPNDPRGGDGTRGGEAPGNPGAGQ